MPDTFVSLDKQIAETEASLRLIEERKSEFVEAQKIDLDLIRNERKLQAQLADLRARRERLRATPCPYRGLEYFDVQHAANYFGRGAMVQKLLAKLAETNFVAVVGPSGCGKSSLVRAGLLPALHRGELPGSEAWQVEAFRPGDDPLRSLALALVGRLMPDASPVDRLAEARKLADHLRGHTLPIADVLAQLRQQLSSPGRLLLIADQFEEAFTLCHDDGCRRAFLDALLAAAETPWATVIAALRADFFGRVLEEERFGPRVDVGLVSVLPMIRDERQAAVEQPALQAGLRFEEGLVERILDAVENAPGDLPLLEFALTELWQRQTADGLLTHAAYEEIGEVRGAIARRADATLAGMDAAQRQAVAAVFTRLVRLAQPDEGAEDTRRRAILDELPAEAWPLVKQLADARLLVTSSDPATGKEVIEVAHEALIRGWNHLREWLNTDRAFLLWRQRLRETLVQWERAERDDDNLLRGAPLVEAQRWLAERSADLNSAEQCYIRESAAVGEQERTGRERLRKRIVSGLVVGLIAALSLAGFAGLKWRQVEEQRRLIQARQLAAESQNVLDNSDRGLVRSVLLAAESLRRSTTPEGDAALRRGLALMPRPALRIVEQWPVWATALSRDGHWLASISGGAASASGEIKLGIYDVVTGQQAWSYPGGWGDTILISPDGIMIAVQDADATVRVRQIATGKEVMHAPNCGRSKGLAFSADSRLFAAQCSDDTVQVWEVASGRQIMQVALTAAVLDGAFSSDGTILTTRSMDGVAQVWSVATGDLIAEMRSSAESRLSADGRWLVRIENTYSDNAAVVVSEIATGKDTAQFPQQFLTHAMALSPNGRLLATMSGYPSPSNRELGAVRVWDVAGEHELTPLIHEGLVQDIDFSPDSQWIATAAGDRTARVWNAVTGREIARLVHEADVGSVTFSADGHWLVTTNSHVLLGSESVRVWEIDRDQGVILASTQWNPGAAAFSPDGERFAATNDRDTVHVYETATGHDVVQVANKGVRALALDLRGTRLATAGTDDAVRVWDLATVHELVRIEYNCIDIALSADGKWLATFDGDSAVRIWDAITGQGVTQVTQTHVSAVGFAPDGRLVATAGLDGVASVWDAATGAEVTRLLCDQPIWGLTFSPDSKRLATACGNPSHDLPGKVLIWDIDSGRQVGHLKHDSYATVAVFSADGHWIATGGRDHVARIWDVSSGREVARITLGSTAESMAFSLDGRWLATASENEMRRSLLQSADLGAQACRRLNRNLTPNEWSHFVGDEPYRPTCPDLPVVVEVVPGQ